MSEKAKNKFKETNGCTESEPKEKSTKKQNEFLQRAREKARNNGSYAFTEGPCTEPTTDVVREMATFTTLPYWPKKSFRSRVCPQTTSHIVEGQTQEERQAFSSLLFKSRMKLFTSVVRLEHTGNVHNMLLIGRVIDEYRTYLLICDRCRQANYVYKISLYDPNVA